MRSFFTSLLEDDDVTSAAPAPDTAVDDTSAEGDLNTPLQDPGADGAAPAEAPVETPVESTAAAAEMYADLVRRIDAFRRKFVTRSYY